MHDICWLLSATVDHRPEGPTSRLASARYRALIPAGALSGRGYRSTFVSPAPDLLERLPYLANGRAPDVLVVSKCFDPMAVAIVERARALGTAIIVDYCDDHFDRPDIGTLQLTLGALADAVTVPTPAMAFAVARRLGTRAIEVGDPIESPPGDPEFAPAPAGDGRIRLLWFGHPVNLGALRDSIPDLKEFAARRPIHLRLVTTLGPALQADVAGWMAGSDTSLVVDAVDWSPEAVWSALRDSDAVIIPVDAGPRSWVKSPNRMVEAIQAGRLVIAQPLPSYKALGEGGVIVDRLSAGLDLALADPDAALRMIVSGQKRVRQLFGPEAIADAWEDAFRAASVNRDDRMAAEPAPIRLNIGCGDKILSGYINCDALASRGGGGRVDVLCDIAQPLPFADGTVDELLAVHVIEHMWPWQTPDILRDWRRVLKPGGRIVLECPNLLTACEEILRNPATVGPGPEGQRTMWVLYGDPRWRDPLMTHRWAFTPESLKAALLQAGFTRARQEPAQFKLREPRDMRIVAEAP